MIDGYKYRYFNFSYGCNKFFMTFIYVVIMLELHKQLKLTAFLIGYKVSTLYNFVKLIHFSVPHLFLRFKLFL